MKDSPYRIPAAPGEELVELVDARDRPLMVVPRSGVRRFGLARRVVLVALRDLRRRIFIQQRGMHCDAMPGYWDLSATGHIHAGESREDAARRELNEEIGIHGVRLIRVAERSPVDASTSFSTLFIAGPTGDIPVPNPAEVSGGFYVDEDELKALVRYTPELITPALYWALGTGLLFKPRPKK